MKFIFLLSIIFFNIKYLQSSPLVNIDWLSKNICKESIKVIEVGKSLNSYKVEHINCSIYTNFYKDKWRIKKNNVPYSLPDPNHIKRLVESFGIKENDTLVLYPKRNDKYAIAEVTSIYFTLKFIGHKSIYILDGGFYDFKKKYPFKIDEGPMQMIKKSNYKLHINTSIIANFEDVKDNIKFNKVLVDSRENDFFHGINKLKNFQKFGTIRGATNIPSMWNLENRGLKFNNLSVLKKIYKIKNIDGKNDHPIFFCYAGIESSINWFVSSEILKHQKARLYEPSLYEWHERDQEFFVK